MTDIIEQLNWRYATKQFDPTFKLSSEQLEKLTEVLRLSPSSFGLQPWGFVVVSDPDVRKKLRAAAWDQPQITDASHLVVMCRVTEVNQDKIDTFIAQTAKDRGQEVSELAGFSQMLTGSILSRSKAELESWTGKQVYIALGFLLAVCAIDGIDACPMEGFDNAAFDTILGLEAKGLASCAVCAVGKRSKDDKYAHAVKVRFPKEEVITHI